MNAHHTEHFITHTRITKQIRSPALHIFTQEQTLRLSQASIKPEIQHTLGSASFWIQQDLAPGKHANIPQHILPNCQQRGQRGCRNMRYKQPLPFTGAIPASDGSMQAIKPISRQTCEHCPERLQRWVGRAIYMAGFVAWNTYSIAFLLPTSISEVRRKLWTKLFSAGTFGTIVKGYCGQRYTFSH